MKRGFLYLCAVLDWASRRVLAWRLSNTLTTDFCLDAVGEAITRYGPPEIFNTDQGCQFTSQAFTGLLNDMANPTGSPISILKKTTAIKITTTKAPQGLISHPFLTSAPSHESEMLV